MGRCKKEIKYLKQLNASGMSYADIRKDMLKLLGEAPKTDTISNYINGRTERHQKAVLNLINRYIDTKKSKHSGQLSFSDATCRPAWKKTWRLCEDELPQEDDYYKVWMLDNDNRPDSEIVGWGYFDTDTKQFSSSGGDSMAFENVIAWSPFEDVAEIERELNVKVYRGFSIERIKG